MSHTPTPWQVIDNSVFDAKYKTVAEVELERGLDDATPYRERTATDNANAAFIVCACNAHDELVAALREIVSADAITAHKIASAALAKVQATDKVPA